MASRILVVDDEDSIVKLVTYNLRKEGFETEAAFDGQEALEKIRKNPPDLVVLDLMLPEVSGLDVCRIVRKEDYDIPVLILTAKDSEIDKVLGLEIGADDYLTKPFSPRELVARVRAVLRRTLEPRRRNGGSREMAAASSVESSPNVGSTKDETANLSNGRFGDRVSREAGGLYEADAVATVEGPTYHPESAIYTGRLQSGGAFSVGDITVDVDRHEVTLSGRRVELTPKEFQLLLAFVRNPGKVLTRDFLLDTIWGYDFYGDTRVVDVHVSHLRDKIEEDSSNPKYLKTVRGVGYKLE